MNASNLIVRAWNGRWPAAKFSVQCKNCLDHKDLLLLPSALLSHALPGTTPNTLLLSYLQHLLSSQVISLDQVVSAAVDYTDVGKPSVLISLTQFFKTNFPFAISHVMTKGAAVFSLMLARLVAWLFKHLYEVLVRSTDKQRPDIVGLYNLFVSMSCDVLDLCASSREHILLLRMLKSDQSADVVFGSMAESMANLQTILPDLRERRAQIVDRLSGLIGAYGRLDVLAESVPSSYLVSSPTTSIASMVTIEAIMRPAEPVALFVELIVLFKQLQGIDSSIVLCEVVRSSLVGLMESEGQDQVHWSCFTLVKLPSVLKHLTEVIARKPDDLELALKSLLGFRFLLEQTKNCFAGNVFKILVQELGRLDLLSASAVDSLSAVEINAQHPSEGGSSVVSNTVELRSQLSAMLSTTANVNHPADLSHAGRAILDMLTVCLVQGHVDHLCLVAANSGRLTQLAECLVRLNTLSVRAGELDLTVALCDVTFLIFVHAALLIGFPTFQKMIDLTTQSYPLSLWLSQHFEQVGTVSASSQANVSMLLSKMASHSSVRGSLEFSSLQQDLPYAFLELIRAWIHGAVGVSLVEEVAMDILCISSSLALRVCIVLSTSCRTVPQHAVEKHVYAMRLFTQQVPIDKYHYQGDHMALAVTKLLDAFGLSPEAHSAHQELTCSEPLVSSLAKAVEAVIDRGFVSTRPLKVIAHIVKICCPKWLAQQMINILFKCSYVEDTSKAVAVLHVICHLNLSQMTTTFLHDYLPDLLQKTAKPTLLAEPRSQATCQLSVWCFLSLSVTEKYQPPNSPNIMSRLIDSLFSHLLAAHKAQPIGQAVYMIGIFIHNMICAGPPYSTQLLTKLPLELVSSVLADNPAMVDIVARKAELNPSDLKKLATAVCEAVQMRKQKCFTRSEA